MEASWHTHSPYGRTLRATKQLQNIRIVLNLVKIPGHLYSKDKRLTEVMMLPHRVFNFKRKLLSDTTTMINRYKEGYNTILLRIGRCSERKLDHQFCLPL